MFVLWHLPHLCFQILWNIPSRCWCSMPTPKKYELFRTYYFRSYALVPFSIRFQSPHTWHLFRKCHLVFEAETTHTAFKELPAKAAGVLWQLCMQFTHSPLWFCWMWVGSVASSVWSYSWKSFFQHDILWKIPGKPSWSFQDDFRWSLGDWLNIKSWKLQANLGGIDNLRTGMLSG